MGLALTTGLWASGRLSEVLRRAILKPLQVRDSRFIRAAPALVKRPLRGSEGRGSSLLSRIACRDLPGPAGFAESTFWGALGTMHLAAFLSWLLFFLLRASLRTDLEGLAWRERDITSEEEDEDRPWGTEPSVLQKVTLPRRT